MDNAEKLNMQLYEKMLAEQKAYREQLLSMTPGEMLDASYEYNLRGDILGLMGVHSLPDEQAKALLQSNSPISDVLCVYKNMETHHMDEVLKAINSLNDKRNALVEQGKDTEFVDDTLIDVMDAPTKKQKRREDRER